MWRSERMSYMRLLVPNEVAHSFVDEIGRSGVMQFVDLNADMQTFQRRFVRDIMQISEVNRLVASIERYLNTYDVPHQLDTNLLACDPITKESIDHVISTSTSYHKRLVNDFHVAQEFRVQLQQEQELESVLECSQKFLVQQASEARQQLSQPQREESEGPLLRDVEARGSSVSFRYIGGVISKSQQPTFERQVFLASRGNAYTIFMNEKDAEKDVFVVFFLGANLDRKMSKLCQVMSIQIYLRPEEESEIQSKLTETRKRQSEIRETLYKTELQLRQDLFGVSSQIGTWKRILDQGRYIYSQLDMFRSNSAAQMLQVEGWVPAQDQLIVREALRLAMDAKGFSQGSHPSVVQELPIDADKTPPTFFRTNKFTSVYQVIVDTYGIPRYGEVNPGFLTIVTFPFLFGVMYGDVFHGTFLFLFALFLVLREKELGAKQLDEFLGAAFNGRYVLLLMGMFAVYCGFIYNDFTSMPLHIWPSSWNAGEKVFEGVYPFGIDWMWYGSDVELAFLNSTKMKLSIIIGVTQMTVGLCLSLLNHIHFREWVNIYCEFIPQIIFLLSFFGYMVYLILLKWTINFNTWEGLDGVLGADQTGTNNAPNLIAVLINIFLNPGTVEMPLYHGQAQMQNLLMVLMGIAIPWMLLPKPFILKWQFQKKMQALDNAADADYQALSSEPLLQPDDVSVSASHSEPEQEEFDFGEVFVHQVIHTIEFVLGCVSNTASYLRLWALSLAHGQLASVFFSKLLSGNFSSVLGVYIGFAFFAGATFAVLLCMDVLECFLHALRLHWVEFQNKFYYADGAAFEPFYYPRLTEAD